MLNSQQRATSLLQHYLRLAAESSGPIRWDSDNDNEVADIVDSIIDACTPPTPTDSTLLFGAFLHTAVKELQTIAAALQIIIDDFNQKAPQ